MPETSQPAKLPFLQKPEKCWEVSQAEEWGCASWICQGFTHPAGDRRGCLVLCGCKENCCWQGSSPGLSQGRMKPGVGGSEPGWAKRWFLMARRKDLLGSAGREHSVTAGAQPFMPTRELGSVWQLPTLKAFDFFKL